MVEDPLSSAIQDLTKLTTDATATIEEAVIPSRHSVIDNNEENHEYSVGSPDSLDMCNTNNRPIPPPRTKIPATGPTSCNSTATSSTLQNNINHKQTRSESDHDLLLSLAGEDNAHNNDR